MIKFTNPFLHKLEELISEAGYFLRYEKGNFKSGFCVLKKEKIIIVNKFFSLEGKINSIVEILKDLPIEREKLTPSSLKLYQEILGNNQLELEE